MLDIEALPGKYFQDKNSPEPVKLTFFLEKQSIFFSLKILIYSFVDHLPQTYNGKQNAKGHLLFLLTHSKVVLVLDNNCLLRCVPNLSYFSPLDSSMKASYFLPYIPPSYDICAFMTSI